MNVEELYLKIDDEWNKLNKIAKEYSDEIEFLKGKEDHKDLLEWFEEKYKEATLARAELGLAKLGLSKAEKKVDNALEESEKIYKNYEVKVLKKKVVEDDNLLSNLKAIVKK